MSHEEKKQRFSKTDMTMLVLVVLLAVFGLACYLAVPVNIMAEYVSATLPIILRSSYLPQHWDWGQCMWFLLWTTTFLSGWLRRSYLLSMALSTAVLLVRPGDQWIETVAESGPFILSAVGICQGGSDFVSAPGRSEQSRQYRRVLVYVQDHAHFASHCGAGRLQ